jgi:hypothetical protein
MRKYIFTEQQIKKVIDGMVNEDLDFQSFREDESLEGLRKAIDANRLITVLFVKKDGSIKQMLIKKFLSSYVRSENPKTELQQDVFKNNNLKAVIDMGAYRKELRDMRAANPGMDDNEVKKMAGDKAWRRVSLPNVLGFLVGGKFIDLRDENEILQRFGQQVYDSLTPSMVAAVERENQANAGNEEEMGEQVVAKNATAAPLPIVKTENWKGFANYLRLTFDYVVDEASNKATYTMENKLTSTITFTQSEVKPTVGAITMEITFIDPNIVKVNGPTISKIASTLGTKLTNNSIIGNIPQGYLTQVIVAVAKMLYKNVKVDGRTVEDIEGDKIKMSVMGQSN